MSRVPAVVLLLCVAPLLGGSDDVIEVRNASRNFLRLLQQNAPPDRMFRLFAPGAFDNPVTRLVVVFTGGSATDPAPQIRRYVAEALRQVAEARSIEGAKCPDVEFARTRILEGLQLANDPDADGFSLIRIDEPTVALMSRQEAAAGPQFEWLKERVAQGRRLVGMDVQCNHVPLGILWERQLSGKWLIIGFAVAAD